MTSLRFSTLTMPAAQLGPENPLPPLQPPPTANAALQLAPGVPTEVRQELEAGRRIGSQVLPYRLQDGYNRVLSPRAFHVAVLENEILRATFLLPLGGRLWSLIHKPSGEELLYVNPVFQPANLARRNAWFCGGVEWNASVDGHSPLTCEPLFVAVLNDARRGPVLRQYEWDRVRGATFQIDAYLPAGSPVLLVRVRLRNPRPEAIPTYWWSNIAVPEEPGRRVIVPADHAMQFSYGTRMNWVPVPDRNGVDTTYPEQLTTANDFFYHIPTRQRRWIASVDSRGSGLVQTSTAQLRGRKLFAWGQGPGGHRWQRFLSPRGGRYIELQAGLALTQGMSLPFPAHACREWLEAYGRVSGKPAVLHGRDWREATGHVAAHLDSLCPESRLESELDATRNLARRAPDEIMQSGSGWGALEEYRRARDGESALGSPATPFPATTLAGPQRPWRLLLENGRFPEHPVNEPPPSWMVQPAWRRRLAKAVESGASDHWAARLQLGVMAYALGEPDTAKREWEHSLQAQPNAWTLRNLAVLERDAGRYDQAADLYRQAVGLRPSELRLVTECLQTLLDAGRAADVETLMAETQLAGRQHPRVRQLRMAGALATGNRDSSRRLLDAMLAEEPIDIREGEDSLADLWFRYHELRLATDRGSSVDDDLKREVRRNFPPPPAIDFRMRIEADEPCG